MNQQLKQAKQTIRRFLQEHYTNERLAMLLAHAQSGRLCLLSCCCLVGIPTANHALRGYTGTTSETHLMASVLLEGAKDTVDAFDILGYSYVQQWSDFDYDGVRRRRLIPIVKAEIKRRERQRSLTYALAAIGQDQVKGVEV